MVLEFYRCSLFYILVGIGPIPNPQSPIPNPQSPIPNLISKKKQSLKNI